MAGKELRICPEAVRSLGWIGRGQWGYGNYILMKSIRRLVWGPQGGWASVWRLRPEHLSFSQQ